MKIVFYETKFNRYSINSLLGALEQRGLLDFIDIEISSLISEQIKLRDAKDLMFCYSFCSPQIKEIEESLRKTREKFPEAVFVAGGPHPTARSKDTLNMGFDYVFAGEAEEIFPEFIEKIRKNSINQRILRGKKVEISNYQSFSLRFKRFSPIEITRGCPFACKFCQTSYIFGTKPRHRSIESILFYVENFVKQGKRDLRFITPNAFCYGSKDGKTVNFTEIERLLKSIKQTYKDVRIFFGTFPSEVRPEHVTSETLKLISQYVYNRNLTIGAQSGSERVLERLNRGHTVEDIYNAINTALNSGFSVNVDFIFGLPEETKTEQIETIKFIEKIIKLGYTKSALVKIHAHHFIPFPGTPFQNHRPSKLTKELTGFLGKLYNLKNIFGQWHLQKRYSENL